MQVQVGTEHVSGHQKRLLRHTKRIINRGEPADSIIEYLLQIAADEDIQDASEQLHPDWIPLYSNLRGEIASLLPEHLFERLDQVFNTRVVDPAVSNIRPSQTNLMFLLGAGASKPKPSGIPTVKELLPDLLMRARRLDREDVNQLVTFCENADIDNVEDLLTAAQLAEFCSRNPPVLRLLDFLLYGQRSSPPGHHLSRRSRSVDLSSVAFLQDTLQVVFGLLSSRMLPAKPNPGHRAIAAYISEKPNTAVVTTNYDCCMDLALGREGQDFSYHIDFANQSANTNGADLPPLIKLHGSLNWFYCETCQEVHLIDIKETVKDYLADRRLYPVIGVCRECGGQRRGLLVPPLAMKFDIAPPLNPLLLDAQTAFSNAEVVAVVGFSFADADLYISRMLTKWMQTSTDAKMLVFDPNHTVVNRIRRQFARRIPDFQSDKRILWIRGDCAETLPSFLGGEFVEAENEEDEGESQDDRVPGDARRALRAERH